jgi:CubicO group peptidase (beta-lactamase class C family)
VSDGLDAVGLALPEALKRISAAGLLARPGSCWGYSLATDVLGAVLERAAGETLPKIVSKLVTGPLNLNATSFSVSDTGRLAIPYTNASPPARMRDGDIVRFGDGAGILFCPTRVLDPRSYPSGGVGMVGNALEFLQFLEAIRQGGRPILDSDSARALMANQIGDLRVDLEATSAWGFGYGGAVLVDATLACSPQNSGTWKWGGVYGHHWYVDPSARIAVVALTNTAMDGMVGAFPQALLNAVYDVSPSVR